MIQAAAATGGVAEPAQTDPDDHIADDGTAAGARGLWTQAEISVGMILGLTTDTQDDGIFCTDPRSGQTPDLDVVDDVIQSLKDTIAAPSDLDEFGRESEDQAVLVPDASQGGQQPPVHCAPRGPSRS